MKTITINVTDEQYRRFSYILRLAYGKDKRTGLDRLSKIVLFRAVADAARKELEENSYHVKAADNGEA